MLLVTLMVCRKLNWKSSPVHRRESGYSNCKAPNTEPASIPSSVRWIHDDILGSDDSMLAASNLSIQEIEAGRPIASFRSAGLRDRILSQDNDLHPQPQIKISESFALKCDLMYYRQTQTLT